jgi:hypothetical protein
MPFDCPVWQSGKVHRDHHVVFNQSFYSVPTRYIGETVWLRGSLRLVQIYWKEQLIKTHLRAKQPGQWITDTGDYPNGARAFLEQDREACLIKAKNIGESTYQVIAHIFKVSSLTYQRKCQAILRLANIYGESRLEASCQRALLFNNMSYRSIKRILELPLIESPLPVSSPPPLLPHTAYLREANAFALTGGTYDH